MASCLTILHWSLQIALFALYTCICFGYIIEVLRKVFSCLFDCDELLIWQGLNSNLVRVFYLYLCSFEESYLLVYHGRSRRPGAEDWEWSHRSNTRWPDDREVGWRRVWSAPYTWRRGAHVSWLSLKTKVDDLSVVWPQNHWDGFLQFDLKIGGDGFLRFSLKTGGDSFLLFDLKIGGDGFSGLTSKSVVTVFLIEPQNQGGGGFPGLCLKIDSYGLVIWASKSQRRFLDLCLKTRQVWFVSCVTKPTGECDGVGHTSRSNGLLRVEASLARISQSGLKTDTGATTDGARGTITKVASE
jgi:hypothetical protein